MSKIALFERGCAKWIRINPGKPATLHSSIEDATLFDPSFADDKIALRDLIHLNNLDWLLRTLEFHNVTEKGNFWRYVSRFPVKLD